MSITTTISKPLDQGYVQVDAISKYGNKSYYKVPRQNAKEFAFELKKQDKQLSTISNITLFASIIIGIAAASVYTKKLESALHQMLIQTISAIGLSTLTNFAFTKYAQTEEFDLKRKYNAKEIYYKN